MQVMGPFQSLPSRELQLSVVIPCLNEADTLVACIRAAQEGIREAELTDQAEIVVADNGSRDASVELAISEGVRVVAIKERGYGSALMGGIEASRGKWIVMGDADCSYDFREIPRFMAGLREGFDLVQGCRLPAGGGRVLPGAMPFLHRWLGNPLFTFMARWMFRAPINDIYCGLRAFTAEHYERLQMRCTGMEFAVEMIIKSAMMKASLSEVPITLHPDQRKSHAPHLKTFRDGWRTLRFLLMSSPRTLFYIPGYLLIFLGLLLFGMGLQKVQWLGVTFEAHALLLASLCVICGYQALAFAVVSQTYGVVCGMLPEQQSLSWLFKKVKLEHGLFLALAMELLGFALLGLSFWEWKQEGWGPRDYAETLVQVIPGVTLVALGFQTLLNSFLISILGTPHRLR